VRVRLAAGLLSEARSRYEKALEEYQQVQDLESGNIDALLRIAAVYDKLDMPDRAIETYQRAIELDPAYYGAYHGKGVFYYYRGKYSDAVVAFRESIKQAPGRFDEYTNLAAALDDLGQDDEAEKALRASLNLHETANGWNSLGAIRAYQKKDVEAITYYERAVAMDPNDYVYWLNLGDSHRRLGHVADSKLAYRKGMSLASAELQENPKLGLTRGYFAYFRARLGDADRAEDEIGQAVRLSPGDNKVIRKAVLTYEALGQRDRAIAVLAGATPDLLHELSRQPDLAEFCRDSRFQQLMERL
jgi:tetratricopeptide (TPR) repeat protein